MPILDPLDLARRQVAALRDALVPILRSNFTVHHGEHVDEIVSDLMRLFPSVAGDVLNKFERGENVGEYLRSVLTEYDVKEPFNLEPIVSREAAYALYAQAYLGDSDFSVSGGGRSKNNYSRSYLWSNYADPGGGEAERRQHVRCLRLEIFKGTGVDPLPAAKAAAEREGQRGYTKPVASKSGGHIQGSIHNPPSSAGLATRTFKMF